MAEDKARAVEEEAPAVPARSKTKTIMIALVGGLLLIGASVGATLLIVGQPSNQAAEEEETVADAKQAKDTKDTKAAAKKKKGKKGKQAEEPQSPIYLPLEPAFVVNSDSQSGMKFLQVSMEIMAHDPAVIEEAKKHMPLIRNNLVMLLSSQTYADVSTRDGKEKVRAAALTEIQKILEQQTGKQGVEAVYFTSFVMQ